MNDQELYVPEASGDNLETPAVGVPIQDAVPELTADNAHEALPQAEIGEPAMQLAEEQPDTAETARQVFSADTPKPFVVNLHLTSTARHGRFVPKATMEIDASLRTSGLLAALPAEEVKTLIALLTFLTPNGDVKPTAWEVSQGLGISEGKARERLSRLARFRWQARPLIATLWRESGVDGYTLSPDAASYRSAAEPASASQQTYRAAGREAVIAMSRARYSRPRADVERQIAMMQGWPLPDEGVNGVPADSGSGESHPAEYVMQRLMRLGVTAEQAGILVETFPVEEIELQIAWLPYRGAKNPASYLVAAITGQYEEPGLLRMKREQQALVPPEPTGDQASWQEAT